MSEEREEREERAIEGAPERKPGLFSRHPRFGILAIGILFLIPICVMVIVVFVLILMQIQNAQ